MRTALRLRNQREGVDITDVPARLAAFGNESIGTGSLEALGQSYRGNDRNDPRSSLFQWSDVGAGVSGASSYNRYLLADADSHDLVEVWREHGEIQPEWPGCARLDLLQVLLDKEGGSVAGTNDAQSSRL